MTPRISWTMASSACAMRFTKVDLPTFGRPTTATMGRAWRILYVRGRRWRPRWMKGRLWPDARARAARCRARASISGRNSDGLQDTTASGTPASFSISSKLMSSSVSPSSLNTTRGITEGRGALPQGVRRLRPPWRAEGAGGCHAQFRTSKRPVGVVRAQDCSTCALRPSRGATGRWRRYVAAAQKAGHVHVAAEEGVRHREGREGAPQAGSPPPAGSRKGCMAAPATKRARTPGRAAAPPRRRAAAPRRARLAPVVHVGADDAHAVLEHARSRRSVLQAAGFPAASAP